MAGGDRAYIVVPADVEEGEGFVLLLANPHSLADRYVARGGAGGGVAGAHCSQRDLSGISGEMPYPAQCTSPTGRPYGSRTLLGGTMFEKPGRLARRGPRASGSVVGSH